MPKQNDYSECVTSIRRTIRSNIRKARTNSSLDENHHWIIVEKRKFMDSWMIMPLLSKLALICMKRISMTNCWCSLMNYKSSRMNISGTTPKIDTWVLMVPIRRLFFAYRKVWSWISLSPNGLAYLVFAFRSRWSRTLTEFDCCIESSAPWTLFQWFLVAGSSSFALQIVRGSAE